MEGLLSTPCGWVSLYLWLSLPKHTLSGDGTVNRFVITFTNLLLFRSLLFISRIRCYFIHYLLFNDFGVVLFVLFVVYDFDVVLFVLFV